MQCTRRQPRPWLEVVPIPPVTTLKNGRPCRTKYKLVSHDVLYGRLEITAHDMFSMLYNVTMDETADIPLKGQVSICFSIVHCKFETQELFCEFFGTPDTRAATPFGVLKDVLWRFNLTIGSCRGQGYDDAVNIRGQHCGLQAFIQQEKPRALIVHRQAHILSWCCRT